MSDGPYDHIKKAIVAAHDMHQVADWLGLKRGRNQKGADIVYHSPHHKDKNPSLSIFTSNNRAGWLDHSDPANKGDVFALVMYCQNIDFMPAFKWLADKYGIEWKAKTNGNHAIQRNKEWHETVAERCLASAKTQKKALYEYLEGRGIDSKVIDAAVSAKTLGFNEYCSPSIPPNEIGHAGLGVSFIVRGFLDNFIEAVDTRYLDADLNGGVKTNSLGKKTRQPWCSDWRKFKYAKTCYVVEAAINALSIESVGLYDSSAVALRGLSIAQNMNLEPFKGKFVVLVPDYDKPFGNDHKLANHRPGPEMMWKLYDRFTEAGIACIILDQMEWQAGWDVNDFLLNEGKVATKTALKKFEQGMIAGFNEGHEDTVLGVKRIFLPEVDYKEYWRFKVSPDFTRYIGEFKKDKETGIVNYKYVDCAGFRVAGVERLSIQDWKSSCYGTRPQQPEVVFLASAQSPHNQYELMTETMSVPQFSALDNWRKFGAIFAPQQFMRLVTIMSRTIQDKQRNAVNFVGLVYKSGKPVVNDGDDCFFHFPAEQCPYHNLRFQSGTAVDARQVVQAFRQTFTNGGGLMPLVWSLGAHLKLFTGFWPHMSMEAEKAAGKSTYMDKLASTLSMQVFSSATLTSEYQVICSTSYSTHPVMWEELSSSKRAIIDSANKTLQQSYNYRYSKRGNQGKTFVTSIPVFLGGEEVDMKSLDGKMVRTSITEKDQGPEISHDLPEFPMRNWLEYLSELTKDQVLKTLEQHHKELWIASRADKKDGNAKRMVKNFAVVRMAWRYLCEFAGMDPSEGGFEIQIINEMNSYLADTVSTREPWIWIVEIVLSEIDAGRFPYPYTIDHNFVGDDACEHPCLMIRHTHMMNHLAHSSHLKDRLDAMPIKTARNLKKQMMSAGVVVGEGVERSVARTRISNMTAISLDKLSEFGLSLSRTNISSEYQEAA